MNQSSEAMPQRGGAGLANWHPCLMLPHAAWTTPLDSIGLLRTPQDSLGLVQDSSRTGQFLETTAQRRGLSRFQLQHSSSAVRLAKDSSIKPERAAPRTPGPMRSREADGSVPNSAQALHVSASMSRDLLLPGHSHTLRTLHTLHSLHTYSTHTPTHTQTYTHTHTYTHTEIT